MGFLFYCYIISYFIYVFCSYTSKRCTRTYLPFRRGIEAVRSEVGKVLCAYDNFGIPKNFVAHDVTLLVDFYNYIAFVFAVVHLG